MVRSAQGPGCGQPEPLLTIKDAADALGIPAWKLRRAVKAGLIPSFTLLNSRRLVRLSEVIAVIESSREGGLDHG